MLERILNPIFGPFRALRSKVFAVKQAPAQLKGELNRAKFEAQMVRGDMKRAQEAAQSAKGAKGKLKGASAAGKAKMGLFSTKPKCEGCGKKLHPSWDECPYCGFGKAAGKGAAAAGGEARRSGSPGASSSAPSLSPSGGGGGAQRTVALEVGASPVAGGLLGWLVPLEGSKMGELFPLRGRVTVGTAADNDIVIPESSISGHHCEIVAGSTGFSLNDLGSTNGTFVNDRPIRTHELVDNDNVVLGRIRFKFKSLN
jgi:hypothetical protein